ncbi:hypothetical protein [Terriglobus albidus]|nr:hypothetical protein [Terriglobus albidus]
MGGEAFQVFQKAERIPDLDTARKEWTALEREMRVQLAKLGREVRLDSQ